MQREDASKIQEQFWLLQNLDNQSVAYNIPCIFELPPFLSSQTISKIISRITDRHDSLRTHFKMEDKKLYQFISAPGTIYPDIEEITIKDASIDHEKLLLNEANKPFDMTIAPLMRVKIFEFSRKRRFLSMVFHHSIIDLRSKEIFAHEFNQFFAKIEKNKAPDLSPEQVKQYKDYSAWHNKWLSSRQAQGMISEWIKKLPDKEKPISLPLDAPRPRHFTMQGYRKHFEINSGLTKKIHNYAVKNTSFSFVVMLTAYFLFLYKITGRSRIIVGVPLTNRRNSDFNDTFGCFVNTVPLMLEVDQSQSIDSLRKQIRFGMLDAHRKQEIPLLNLLEASNFSRSPAVNPFFQVGFTFEPPMRLKAGNDTLKPVAVEKHGSQLELFLTLWEEGNQFHGFMEYSSAIFNTGTINRLIDYYQDVLLAMTQGANKMIQIPAYRSGDMDKHITTRVKTPLLSEEESGDTGAVETSIRGMWEDLFKEKCNEVNRNFFEIGGNSLLAIELTNRLNKTFAIHIQPTSIFEYPTLRSLTSFVAGQIRVK